MRIVAQLVDSSTEGQIWAETYDRDLTDVFAIQSEVAMGIANALKAKLRPDERRNLRDHASRARAPNPQAYDAYLRGRFHLYQHDPRNLETALRWFEEALEHYPDYALALGAVADTWGARTHLGLVAPNHSYPIVKERVRDAFQLDDTLPETNDWIGRLRCWFEWDWEAAERSFRRAIALSGNYPEARMMYSVLLNILQRSEEAAMQAQRAVELDPLNPLLLWAAALEPLFRRRYAVASHRLDQVLRVQPRFMLARLSLWSVRHREMQHVAAMEQVKEYLEGVGDAEAVQVLTGTEGYVSAMRAVGDLIATRFRDRYVPPTLIARLYAAADDRERALYWLQQGYAERDFHMLFIGVDPIWEELHATDMFRQLLVSMRLQPLLVSADPAPAAVP